MTIDIMVLDVFDALKGLPYIGKNNEILTIGDEEATAPEGNNRA